MEDETPRSRARKPGEIDPTESALFELERKIIAETVKHTTCQLREARFVPHQEQGAIGIPLREFLQKLLGAEIGRKLP